MIDEKRRLHGALVLDEGHREDQVPPTFDQDVAADGIVVAVVLLGGGLPQGIGAVATHAAQTAGIEVLEERIGIAGERVGIAKLGTELE